MQPKGFGYRGYHFADAPFNPRLHIYEPFGFRKYGIHGPLKTDDGEHQVADGFRECGIHDPLKTAKSQTWKVLA